MMDCHILSAAHNATITGPKCRVCAAFTIEMRHRDPHYIISPRAEGSASAGEGGRREHPRPSLSQKKTRRVTVWFQHQSPNGFSKKSEWRATQWGEICVGVCDSGSFVCCSPWAKQANMARGSHLIPHWRRDGERMAAVRGSVAALRRVQKYLHQWC